MQIKCRYCGIDNPVSPDTIDENPMCGKCGSYLDYNTLSSDLRGPNYCELCRQICSTGEYLTNGKTCHKDCVEELQRCIKNFDSDIAAHRSNKYILLSRIERTNSWLYKLSVYFGAHEANVKDLRDSIVEIEMQIESLYESKAILKQKLTEIYDYWPYYPPDWELRKKRALDRADHVCSKNSRHKRPIQVHHLVPFSQGGSHLPDNLLVLCERCHLSAHGVSKFNKNSETIKYIPELRRTNPIKLLPRNNLINKQTTKRVRKPTLMSLVKDAIESSKLLHFSYTRKDGAESERTINPKELIRIEKVWCVRGHCYLRSESRTFALKRIRGARLVSTPGDCCDIL